MGEGSLLKTLTETQQATVLGEAQNGWYRVRLKDGTGGYTHESYTTFTKPTERVGYVKVNANVRKGPGTNYALLKTLPMTQQVTVLGDAQNNWYRVRLNDGTEGYTHESYTTFSKPVERNGYIKENANVRSGPSADYKLLTTVRKRQAATIIGELQNNWYRVRLSNGTEGYAHDNYVSFSG